MPFWRSNYKLPLSFIVFFVLMFFLIGEQLVALPLYVLGPGVGPGGPDKLHILDLGPGDALHRPFAYLIIGAVIWAFYRIFAWPIAFSIGAVLWIIEQATLTPLDQRPSLLNSIVFTFTFWPVLTLAPYLIYRWVHQKWKENGIKNTIIIIFTINLLVFGFFAFQIYVLHNSYRGLYQNKGHQVNYTNSLPSKTCPDRLITEKDKPTTAYWNGKTLAVSGDVQNWVEENCPGALQTP